MAPNLTEYVLPLGAADFLRVHFDLERGKITRFTVQYETVIGNRLYPVVRYDSAHDQPHRDTLDAGGHVIEKEWLPQLDLNAALTYGEQDVRAHWQRYRAAFLGRMRR